MFAGKKSAQIREILISESAWEEMTCLFAPSLTKKQLIEEAKLKIAIEKCHPNSGMARVEGELFKIALASLEAEPVGDFYEYKPDDW